MKTKHILAATLVACATLNSVAQKFEGLAPTPPMGWNSWNTFACDISEKTVKETADLFIKLGLKDAGYEYVVIDDGWMEMERDPETLLLVPNKVKFPNGIKSVADYVHSKGLKFGIYNCAGIYTCGGYPGTRGFEFIDAKQYAEWGVDFLKFDWCSTGGENGGYAYQQDAKASYTIMSQAIRKAGRPMIFNLCEWGNNNPWEWAAPVGHSWRVSGDIALCWDCELNYGNWASLGFWQIIRKHPDIRKYSGPDHWNDYDMLEVGRGMTAAEDRTHFSMWCMLASPLILGNDISKMNKETLELVTNKELIAVNQDKLGIQGYRFINEDGFELWVKPLSNDEWAFAFVNMTEGDLKISYDWARHYVKDGLVSREINWNNSKFSVRDCIDHKDLGDTSKKFEKTLTRHDIVVLRLTPKK